jgi:penicillin-binding protein 1C
VRLVDLANAYATLARGGVHRPLRVVRAITGAHGREALDVAGETRVAGALSSAMITDVLSDRRARLLAFGDVTALDFGWDVAVKTGTSKGYRDNWTLGYSSAVTVGVWVGNFDGSPMQSVSGVTGAAPIFHAVMEAAMRTRTAARLALDRNAAPVFVPGAGSELEDEARLTLVEVCALSGERATALCKDRVREWMPVEVANNLPLDTHHVLVRVDKRNGLRASDACSASDTELRVYERFEPELTAWALAEKRPMVPADASPFCPPAEVVEHSGALAIRSPMDGTKLVIDPDQALSTQVLPIQVLAPTTAREVTLLVDGVRRATATRPFTFEWPLELGEHTFAAIAPGAPVSAQVHVAVRR